MQISCRQFLSHLSNIYPKNEKKCSNTRMHNDGIDERMEISNVERRRTDQIAAVWESFNEKEISSVSGVAEQFT